MNEVQIVTDSCALLKDDEARELGVEITPILLNLDGSSYRDGVEMSHEQFYKLLRGGAKATTSQPYLGDVVEAFKKGLMQREEDTSHIDLRGALRHLPERHDGGPHGG